MGWGITLGLLTALGHATAYLAARHFTAAVPGRAERSGLTLLALAHVWMAAVAAAALPLLWPDALGFDARWTVPLVGLVGGFALAQWALLSALRTLDASRVAPLLGFKIAVLAGFAAARGEALGASQWAGVGLAVAGALALGTAGGRIAARPAAQVLAACFCYAVCDVLILATIRGAEATAGIDRLARPWVGPAWAVGAVYFSLGVPALLLLPRFGSRRRADWRDALPYAAIWLAAMVTLYGAFARLGTVLGAILQSSRGLIAIVLGVVLAAAGFEHLERRVAPGVVARRALAAVSMVLAVWLYVRQPDNPPVLP